MKKTLLLFLITVSIFSFSACGKKNSSPTSSVSPSVLPVSPSPEPTPEAKKAPEPAPTDKVKETSAEILEDVAATYVNTDYFDSLKKTKSPVKSFETGIFVDVSKDEDGDYTIHQGTLHEGGYFYEKVTDISEKNEKYEIVCTDTDSPSYCRFLYDPQNRNYPQFTVRRMDEEFEKKYKLMRVDSLEKLDDYIACLIFGGSECDKCTVSIDKSGNTIADWDGKKYKLSVIADTGNGEIEDEGADGQLCFSDTESDEFKCFSYTVNKNKINLFDQDKNQIMTFITK